MLGHATALSAGSMTEPAAAILTRLQLDTLLGTACAALLLVGAATWVRARASVGRPGAFQVLGEATVEAADRSIGTRPRWIRDRVVALAVTLFWFIVIANWLHLVPGLSLPAPTADLNLTLALALIVIGSVHATAVQARGVGGYLRHYLSPWWLAPVKVLEELLKPVTLGLRLFGMAFASGLMVVLIVELVPSHVAVVPHALWTLFDLFIGVIQAYVFALLTVLYFHAALPVEAASTQAATQTSRPPVRS